MIRLKYGNVSLQVIDEYSVNKSSQEVQINDIKCDFTGYTKSDLPEKYQEVKLMNDSSIIYFGYVDSYDLGEMRETDIFREINITLLSPMSLATIRYTSAVGTYNLIDLIENTILKPLTEDGFTIYQVDITNRQYTANFMLETIEYCMNSLSNKFNFWWYIDENKNIYVKDINSLFNGTPNYYYDDDNKLSGLQYLKPKVSANNYANVINFKNVRIYEYSRLSMTGSTINTSHNKLIDKQISSLTNGKQLDFTYPCDIKKENIEKSGTSNGITGDLYGLHIKGTYSNNTTFEVYVKDDVNKVYTISSNVGYSGGTDTTKEFLLVRDSFFSNLITGFQYNGTKTINTIELLNSDSVLIWNNNKMYNDKAISDKVGIVSNTGIVETTVDMNSQWKTIQELRDIGVSYMNNNSLELDGEIEMLFDKDYNFKIGQTIKINKMLFDSTFIITNINITHNNHTEYLLTCKNSNMLNSYIDIFRSSETQETSDKVEKIYITHYFEETIKEVHEVV